VIVGPYLEKDVAAKERDKLKKAFKLDGVLIKY
jgi:cell division septation protein DedD